LETKKIRIAELVIKGIDLLGKVRKCEAKDNKVIKAVEKIIME